MAVIDFFLPKVKTDSVPGNKTPSLMGTMGSSFSLGDVGKITVGGILEDLVFGTLRAPFILVEFSASFLTVFIAFTSEKLFSFFLVLMVELAFLSDINILNLAFYSVDC